MADAAPSTAEETLLNTSHIPIAQLTPLLSAPSSRSIKAVVTLIWPYSSVRNTLTVGLAEPDFRLRRARGQVRVHFSGSSAKKLATSKIGSGDELLLSLDGVEWVQREDIARSPGEELEFELKYTEKLLLQIQETFSRTTTFIEIDHPIHAEENTNAMHLLTPEPESVPSPDEFVMLRKEQEEYNSPAFMKRARFSYGSLLDPEYDIFAEADGWTKGKGRKRARYSMGTQQWRYSSRSPSPGVESESVSEQLPLGAKPAVMMVDEGCQTDVDLEESFMRHSFMNSRTEPISMGGRHEDMAVSSAMRETDILPPIQPDITMSYDEVATLAPIDIQHQASIPISPRLQPLLSDNLPLVSPIVSADFDVYPTSQEPDVGVSEDALMLEVNSDTAQPNRFQSSPLQARQAAVDNDYGRMEGLRAMADAAERGLISQQDAWYGRTIRSTTPTYPHPQDDKRSLALAGVNGDDQENTQYADGHIVTSQELDPALQALDYNHETPGFVPASTHHLEIQSIANLPQGQQSFNPSPDAYAQRPTGWGADVIDSLYPHMPVTKHTTAYSEFVKQPHEAHARNGFADNVYQFQPRRNASAAAPDKHGHRELQTEDERIHEEASYEDEVEGEDEPAVNENSTEQELDDDERSIAVSSRGSFADLEDREEFEEDENDAIGQQNSSFRRAFGYNADHTSDQDGSDEEAEYEEDAVDTRSRFLPGFMPNNYERDSQDHDEEAEDASEEGQSIENFPDDEEEYSVDEEDGRVMPTMNDDDDDDENEDYSSEEQEDQFLDPHQPRGPPEVIDLLSDSDDDISAPAPVQHQHSDGEYESAEEAEGEDEMDRINLIEEKKIDRSELMDHSDEIDDVEDVEAASSQSPVDTVGATTKEESMAIADTAHEDIESSIAKPVSLSSVDGEISSKSETTFGTEYDDRAAKVMDALEQTLADQQISSQGAENDDVLGVNETELMGDVEQITLPNPTAAHEAPSTPVKDLTWQRNTPNVFGDTMEKSESPLNSTEHSHQPLTDTTDVPEDNEQNHSIKEADEQQLSNLRLPTSIEKSMDYDQQAYSVAGSDASSQSQGGDEQAGIPDEELDEILPIDEPYKHDSTHNLTPRAIRAASRGISAEKEASASKGTREDVFGFGDETQNTALLPDQKSSTSKPSQTLQSIRERSRDLSATYDGSSDVRSSLSPAPEEYQDAETLNTDSEDEEQEMVDATEVIADDGAVTNPLEGNTAQAHPVFPRMPEEISELIEEAMQIDSTEPQIIPDRVSDQMLSSSDVTTFAIPVNEEDEEMSDTNLELEAQFAASVKDHVQDLEYDMDATNASASSATGAHGRPSRTTRSSGRTAEERDIASVTMTRVMSPEEPYVNDPAVPSASVEKEEPISDDGSEPRNEDGTKRVSFTESSRSTSVVLDTGNGTLATALKTSTYQTREDDDIMPLRVTRSKRSISIISEKRLDTISALPQSTELPSLDEDEIMPTPITGPRSSVVEAFVASSAVLPAKPDDVHSTAIDEDDIMPVRVTRSKKPSLAISDSGPVAEAPIPAPNATQAGNEAELISTETDGRSTRITRSHGPVESKKADMTGSEGIGLQHAPVRNRRSSRIVQGSDEPDSEEIMPTAKATRTQSSRGKKPSTGGSSLELQAVTLEHSSRKPLESAILAADQPIETSRVTRSLAKNTLLRDTSPLPLASPTIPHNTRQRSISIALETPHKTPGQNETNTSSPSIVLQSPRSPGQNAAAQKLTKDLKTNLPSFTSLKMVRWSKDKKADIVAVATQDTEEPQRASKGPRHYMLRFSIVDSSISVAAFHDVQIFRPHKDALPIAEAGEAVLLRRFDVKSEKGKFAFRSTDDSSWVVFKKDGTEQVRGPPLEYGDVEKVHARGLMEWYNDVSKVGIGKEKRVAR